MRLVLLGPPGAGKGTQAERLADHYGIVHISTGDLFRANLREKTALGREAQRYMETGNLVPDSVTEAMVDERLDQPDAAKGFVLDGFPRNLGQAAALERMLKDHAVKLDWALALVVGRDLLVARLTGRRICAKCQATYHVEFNPPVVPGICDRCGGSLVQRSDDSVDTVTRRLEVYDQETAPLLDFYRDRGVLSEIAGVGTVEAVTAKVIEVIG